MSALNAALYCASTWSRGLTNNGTTSGDSGPSGSHGTTTPTDQLPGSGHVQGFQLAEAGIMLAITAAFVVATIRLTGRRT